MGGVGQAAGTGRAVGVEQQAGGRHRPCYLWWADGKRRACRPPAASGRAVGVGPADRDGQTASARRADHRQRAVGQPASRRGLGACVRPGSRGSRRAGGRGREGLRRRSRIFTKKQRAAAVIFGVWPPARIGLGKVFSFIFLIYIRGDV